MQTLDLSACYTIFKLVAGSPESIFKNDMIEPYKTGAISVINSNGRGRPAIFNEWVSTLDKSMADEIRHAMRTWQANGQPDEPPKPKQPIVEESHCPDLPKDARLTPQLERAAQGAGAWLDEYISFAKKAAPMTPREFHEAFALGAISTAIARRISLPVSTTNIYTNMYFLLVASSTLYSKTTGFDLCNMIMERADMKRFTIPPRQSPESLLLELSNRPPQTFNDWERADQDDWRKERVFAAQRVWMIDEASYLFDAFTRDSSSALLTILLDLYNCPIAPRVNTIMRGRQTVRRAYLTFIGATTPDEIAPHLENRANWGNGLWARFCLIMPSEIPEWIFWPKHMDIPNSVTEPIKKLAFEKLAVPKSLDDSSVTGPDEVETLSVDLSNGVFEAWEAYSKATRYDLLKAGEVNPQVYASYGRIGVHAIKVAMLLATMDWIDTKTVKLPRVTLGHYAKGQMIAESWRASLHRMIESPATESTDESNERKVIKYLAKSGDSETLRNLYRHTRIDRDDLEKIVLRLVSDGMVIQEKIQSARGPSTVSYRIANSSHSKGGV